MKQFRNIFLVLVIAGLFGSCNDWLNQTPFDKVPGDQLYKEEVGAQEALNGLYLGLLDRNLYGGELTVGLLEVLSERYVIPTEHKYKDLIDQKYDTDGSKGYFSSIWKNMYRLIAECNVYLKQIEANQVYYDAENYKLYRGEALALRTFLHFDLYRLFAPAYSEANKGKQAIPYYDQETNSPMPYLTGEDLMVKLFNDLDEALLLLEADPVQSLSKLSFEGETFWDFRCLRLNVYAAWALKARMCLYMGDKTTAYMIASSLLSGKNPDGKANNFNVAFPSIQSMKQNYKDLLMFSEVIFGMHDIDRENLHRKYFSLDLNIETILLANDKWRSEMFGTNMLDMRYRGYGEASEKSETATLLSVLKYQKKELVPSDEYPLRNELIPLFRKGELFLIAAEASPGNTEKEFWLESLVIKRGGYQLGDVKGDLDKYIDLEYNRELYAEGQYFYYLKRNGRTSIQKQDGTTKSVGASYFVLPVPDAEKDNRVN